jgi:hypothetical protein
MVTEQLLSFAQGQRAEDYILIITLLSFKI